MRKKAKNNRWKQKKYKKCRFNIDFTKKQFALFYGFFFTWPRLVRPSWRSGVSGSHLDSGSWPKPAIDLDRLQIITVTTFEIAKTSGRPNVCKIIWNEIILTQLLLLFLWDDHTKKKYHHNATTLFVSREITEYDVLKKDMKVMPCCYYWFTSIW